MYRFLTIALTFAMLAGLCSCAANDKDKLTTIDDAEMETAPMADIEPEDDAEEDTVLVVTPDEPAGSGIGGAQVHVVQKGDTLFSLARKYYNDQRMWKSIWEANQDQLPDKDKLRIGMELIIP